MKVQELVKVYRFINDPQVPKVNMKFAALAVFGVLAVAALMAMAPVANDGGYAAPAAESRSEASNTIVEIGGAGTATTFTVYIGYDPATFDPSLPNSEAEIQRATDDWQARNFGALQTARVPVYLGGSLVGYEITYVKA